MALWKTNGVLSVFELSNEEHFQNLLLS